MYKYECFMFSGESIEEVNAELDNLDREEEDYSKKNNINTLT